MCCSAREQQSLTTPHLATRVRRHPPVTTLRRLRFTMRCSAHVVSVPVAILHHSASMAAGSEACFPHRRHLCLRCPGCPPPLCLHPSLCIRRSVCVRHSHMAPGSLYYRAADSTLCSGSIR
ncbi:hypothetical protein NDU88_001547 [Pleurodeles waltl]|uniref:Uncharacterized protein n=1 Tax=Pleurodeles waltl TaxID=8319 RepID=A0AAV7LXY6_PLEWA|nr:hypothetical protein NDU88_001547 [Pleurodeles waltl]